MLGCTPLINGFFPHLDCKNPTDENGKCPDCGGIILVSDKWRNENQKSTTND